MAIDTYSIRGYQWILMIILLMVIGGYFYMTISSYSIDGY